MQQPDAKKTDGMKSVKLCPDGSTRWRDTKQFKPAAVEEEIPDGDHLALAGGIDVLHTPGRLAGLKNIRKFKDAFQVCRARIGGVVRPISYVFQSAGLTRTLRGLNLG